MSKNRIVYLDILRILATLAIVVVHVCAQDWSTPSLDSTKWYIYNIGDSAFRWGVPIFLMISGALFLNPDKELNIKRLFSKNVVRLVSAFVFWSIVYTANSALGSQMTWEQILTKLINGNGHMWFIISILAVYIAIPLLRQITKSKQLTLYFLLASFLLVIVSQTLLYTFSPFLSNYWLNFIVSLLKTNYYELGLGSIIGYSFYFVLGYYLNSHIQTKKDNVIAYIGSLVGFLATILLTHFASLKNGGQYIGFYGDLTINVFLESIGLFILIKNIPWNLHATVEKYLHILSSWCFGSYLVHELVILKLGSVGIHVWAFHPIISIPLVSITVFIISMIISGLLHYIPILKKYVV